MDQMLTLEAKIDKIEEEAEEGDESYASEEDGDFNSELEDKINVDDMPHKVGLGSNESSKHEIKGVDGDERSEIDDDESENQESRSRGELSEMSPSQLALTGVRGGEDSGEGKESQSPSKLPDNDAILPAPGSKHSGRQNNGMFSQTMKPVSRG